ncbi:MAG: hypothetical protein ACTSYI_11845 [Promethearchaeota archaeon]
MEIPQKFQLKQIKRMKSKKRRIKSNSIFSIVCIILELGHTSDWWGLTDTQIIADFIFGSFSYFFYLFIDAHAFGIIAEICSIISFGLTINIIDVPGKIHEKMWENNSPYGKDVDSFERLRFGVLLNLLAANTFANFASNFDPNIINLLMFKAIMFVFLAMIFGISTLIILKEVKNKLSKERDSNLNDMINMFFFTFIFSVALGLGGSFLISLVCFGINLANNRKQKNEKKFLTNSIPSTEQDEEKLKKEEKKLESESFWFELLNLPYKENADQQLSHILLFDFVLFCLLSVPLQKVVKEMFLKPSVLLFFLPLLIILLNTYFMRKHIMKKSKFANLWNNKSTLGYLAIRLVAIILIIIFIEEGFEINGLIQNVLLKGGNLGTVFVVLLFIVYPFHILYSLYAKQLEFKSYSEMEKKYKHQFWVDLVFNLYNLLVLLIVLGFNLKTYKIELVGDHHEVVYMLDVSKLVLLIFLSLALILFMLWNSSKDFAKLVEKKFSDIKHKKNERHFEDIHKSYIFELIGNLTNLIEQLVEENTKPRFTGVPLVDKALNEIIDEKENERFLKEHGFSKENSIQCTICGTTNYNKNKFCSECGNKIE